MNKDNLSKMIEKKINANYSMLQEQFFSKNPNTSSRFFIIDDVLPEKITLEIYKNLPSLEAYKVMDSFRENKLTYKEIDKIENSIIQSITDAFQMKNVISAIKKITNIDNLIADPTLYAGGISRMDFGHFLNPHIDNSHNATKSMYRRLNLLFYVTPGMQESDGGNLELWDKKIKNPVKIPSLFNRLVVMETTKDSWHSVDPVSSNIQRCCVSNYYFSEESPESYEYYHVTSYLGRPEEKFRRFYGKFDNLLRNNFAKITGISRGRKLIRGPKKA